ncbi:MAG: hypothetical protein PCFJNLEI_02710 [Verrucomicrobiae bacterium]|nr:hypothetical protein [Verrucomicrobiae bacterium]
MTRNFQPRAAFTFLELMLAVTLLGLVMAAVFSIWSAGLSGWKRTAGVSDNLQRDRIIMGTLADLTKSIVFVNNAEGLYNVTLDRDPQLGDTVSFVTASTAVLPVTDTVAAGMRRVMIGMQRNEQGRAFLGILNRPALLQSEGDENEPWHVLSWDVSGFAVRLRHPREATMKETWDEPNLPPSAIEYTIAFGVNDGRVPPVVVTRTIETPVAQYAMQLLGLATTQRNTTNTVSRRDIDLADDRDGGSE